VTASGSPRSSPITTTAAEVLVILMAVAAGALVVGLAFSQLRHDCEDRIVFFLAPLAVAGESTGQEICQRLLKTGIAALRGRGVDVVLT